MRAPAVERGSILLQAMIALLLVSLFFALAVEALMSDFRDTRLEVDRRHFQALFDAAIGTTLAQLRDGSAGGVLEEEIEPGGFISSRVEEVGEDEVVVHVTVRLRQRVKTKSISAYRREDDSFVTREGRYWRGPAPGEGF